MPAVPICYEICSSKICGKSSRMLENRQSREGHAKKWVIKRLIAKAVSSAWCRNHAAQPGRSPLRLQVTRAFDSFLKCFLYLTLCHLLRRLRASFYLHAFPLFSSFSLDLIEFQCIFYSLGAPMRMRSLSLDARGPVI